MKTRVWTFALVVLAALVAQVALLSSRVADKAEKTLKARLAVATAGLWAQRDLIDARLSPRLIAQSPELLELLKAPTDVTQPMPKPDERSLKAALTAAAAEPDLLAVANPQGAAVQRKAKGPARMLPAGQIGTLPLARAILEGSRHEAGFAQLDDQLYRVAGAATPGNTGAVVVGTAIDDALAAKLRSIVDADVSFFDGGKLVATSADPALRPQLTDWIKHPSPGFGQLAVHPRALFAPLAPYLPLWADKQAYRASLMTLDSGVQVSVSIPADAQLAWLGRYQAWYAAGLLGFVLLALVFGFLPGHAQAPARAAEQEPRREPSSPQAAHDEPQGWDHLGESRGDPAHPPLEAEEVIEQVEPLPDSALERPKSNIELIDLTATAEAQSRAQKAAHAEPPALPDDALASPEPAQQDGSEEPPPLPPEAIASAIAPELAEPPRAAGEAPAAPLTKAQEFSFAGLLDEANEAGKSAPPAAEPPATKPFPFDDLRETTNPGAPSAALLAQMSQPMDEHAPAAESFRAFEPHKEEPHEYFPGDEPTRIEPVSAALLDKLREIDDPSQAPRTVEHAAEAAQAAAPAQPAAAPAPMPDLWASEPAPAEAAREEPTSGTPTGPIPTAPPEPAVFHPGDESTDEFARHAIETARAEQLQHEAGHAGDEWPEHTQPMPPPSFLHSELAGSPRESHAQPEQRAQQKQQAAPPEPLDPHVPPHDEHVQTDKHAAPPLLPAEPPELPHDTAPIEPRALSPVAPPSEPPHIVQSFSEPPPPAQPQNGAAHEEAGDITLTNLQLPRQFQTPPEIAADPDEPHWRDTFTRFLQTRGQTGEPSDKLSYEKFAAKLKKNREDLLAKHKCRGVRFQVYVKEGKAAIKASAIK